MTTRQLFNKIISSILLTLVLSPISMAKGEEILVILSSSDYLTLKNGHQHPTGYFLSELALPAIALEKAGYKLTFANPKGNQAVMDKISDDPKWFENEAQFGLAKDWLKTNESKLRRPAKLKDLTDLELRKFSGVFVPGGHAPMEDLVSNPYLGKILKHFHENKKPTALICHGPAALLSAKVDGRFIYSGYEMTAFSTEEEKQEETPDALGGEVVFYLEDELRALGANVKVATPWKSSAIRDRELITGQNPMSEKAFVDYFLEALIESKLKNKPLENVEIEQVDEADFSNRLLSVVNKQIDWSVGYSTFYIGLSKTDFPNDDFARRLQTHVAFVKDTFEPMGLDGYVIFSTKDYEIAFMHWPTQEIAQMAFESSLGQLVPKDANEFLEALVWKDVHEVPNFLKKSCNDLFN